MANSIVGTRSPNGAVGVRGVADSGELSMLSAGVLSGFNVAVDTGFNLLVGGVAGVQDVAVAKNSAGESDLLVGNGTALAFTLPGAPGTSGQSQDHSLVIWKDSTVVSAVNDGLDAVGYQVVSGAPATTGSQVVPTDAEIRAAVPNGATAFVAVIVKVTLRYGDASTVASRIMLTNSVLADAHGGSGMSNIQTATAISDLGFTCQFVKWGKTVMVYMSGTISRNLSGGDSMIFFPKGYRPAIPLIISSTGLPLLIVAPDPSGLMTTNSPISAGASVNVTTSYIVP